MDKCTSIDNMFLQHLWMKKKPVENGWRHLSHVVNKGLGHKICYELLKFLKRDKSV